MSKRLQAIPGLLDKMSYSTGLRSAEHLTLPHFLGIGAQKAGTSWLAANLQQHPQVFVPAKKELHYFDGKFHQPLAWYAAQFADAKGLMCGEVTPKYSILPRRRIRFIRRVMPDARLVFLMRNPIDRAWSQAVMRLAKAKNRPVESVTDREFLRQFKHPRSVMRGDYLTTIDRWLSVFPKENLFVGFFEDIAERPRELLADVFAFLGVSANVEYHEMPLRQVVNKGSGRPLPQRLRDRLQQMYRDELARLADRFGAPAQRWRDACSNA